MMYCILKLFMELWSSKFENLKKRKYLILLGGKGEFQKPSSKFINHNQKWFLGGYIHGGVNYVLWTHIQKGKQKKHFFFKIEK